MKTSRYSTSRQKSCQQCAIAKTKCDRGQGSADGRCGRCSRRFLQCTLPLKSPNQYSYLSPTRPERSNDHPSSVVSTVNDFQGSEPTDFANLELYCPINAEDIHNRWTQVYVPVPGQTIKQYTAGVSSFVYSTLRGYTSSIVSGRGIVPFIHAKQLASQPARSPLSTCLNLVKMCYNPIPDSDESSATILQAEMQRIYELRDQYDSLTLFGAFQAYLIYSMVLFFRLERSCDNSFRSLMTKLQEIACTTTRHGIVCATDKDRTRPKWEEWIIAEAKRRTLFVMYLFDNVLSTHEGLPTFLGTELQGLPAPANKLLWSAETRYQWEREYNLYLADWMEGSLTIDELWPTPAHCDDSAVSRRRTRVNQWSENLDEYGTMIYAIMKCTHGD